MQLPGSIHAALRAAALVSQMAILAAVGAGLGVLVDGWLGTLPVFVLILGGLGFAAGLVVVWRAFQAATDDSDLDPPPGPHGTSESHDPSHHHHP